MTVLSFSRTVVLAKVIATTTLLSVQPGASTTLCPSADTGEGFPFFHFSLYVIQNAMFIAFAFTGFTLCLQYMCTPPLFDISWNLKKIINQMFGISLNATEIKRVLLNKY